MVGFSTTLQKDNYMELERIVELAAEVGAESTGIVPLVPYEGLGTLDRVVTTESPKVAAAIGKARERALSLEIDFHVSQDTSRGSSPHPCPYLESTVYIDPDGAIYPCPYWNTENPLGNITEGFNNVWTGKTYARLRRGEFIRKDNCLECPECTGRSTEITKGKQ